jgi:hypothetical protein
MNSKQKCIARVVVSITVLIILIAPRDGRAQQGAISVSLKDMTAFRAQSGNWKIVGDVNADLDAIVQHHETPAPSPQAQQKGKKKSAIPETPIKSEVVSFTDGQGVLLNMNDETHKDNLITVFEHGDIELEFDVIVPKGSNSGVFLQGNYEVQLYDSWATQHALFSDIGGIYRNWESDPQKAFAGIAPLSNASKAPGLWQTIKISFQAPRFDATGKKISNAKFIYIELNGVRIHDNVEVPRLTGSAMSPTEVPTGPIMFQGDHGAVAFRNLRYKLMKPSGVSLNNVSYNVYQGNFQNPEDFATAKPTFSGTSPVLSSEVIPIENGFGVTYAGNVVIPEEAEYTFTAIAPGALKLSVNGNPPNSKSIDQGMRHSLTLSLKPGIYPFSISNNKQNAWEPTRLSFTVSTLNSYPLPLHAFNSFPPSGNSLAPIFIHTESKPKILRAFLDFNGQRSKRLTHTIGVGDPSGIHYIYDLKAGNIVCVWRGDFVDATPMWHDRGDGSFRPLGATQYLFMNQPMAFLSAPTDPFPETGVESKFDSKGYTIDASGRPVFKYSNQDINVEDHIYPADANHGIVHEITLDKSGVNRGLYYKLAEGSTISKLNNDYYLIGDKQYYIKVTSPAVPVIRDSNGVKELIVAVDGTSLKYSIVW